MSFLHTDIQEGLAVRLLLFNIEGQLRLLDISLRSPSELVQPEGGPRADHEEIMPLGCPRNILVSVWGRWRKWLERGMSELCCCDCFPNNPDPDKRVET